MATQVHSRRVYVITRPAIGVYAWWYPSSNWLYGFDGSEVHIVISSGLINVRCEFYEHINTPSQFGSTDLIGKRARIPVNAYVPTQLASPNHRKLSVVEISAGITRPAIGVHTRRYHGSNWLYESDGTGVHIVISNVQCPVRVTWKYKYVGVLCSVDQIIKWACIPVSNLHTQTAGLDQSAQAQCRRDQRRNNEACYRGIYNADP